MHLTITMSLKSILKVSMAILKRSEFAKQIFYALGSNKLSAYCRDKIIYGVLGIGAGNNYDWIFDYIDVNNSRGKVLIEIGSRDALDCLSLMKKTQCSHAYVFEPSIRNLPKLIANILKTKVRNKITLFPIAIGKQILHTNPMGLQLVNFQETSIPGMSSIYPLKSPEQKYPSFLSYHTPGKVIDSYLVPITPLDFLLNYIESDVFLLAIDVEGAEWDVIEGGKESLKITHYICVEFSIAGSRIKQESKNVLSFINMMLILGFSLLSKSSDKDLDDNVTFQVDLLFYNNSKYSYPNCELT